MTRRCMKSSPRSGSSFATGKTRDISFRRQLLINLRSLIRDNEGLILEALRADLGKSYREGYMTEIGMVEQEINHTLRYLKVWNSPKTVPTPYYLWPSSSIKYRHPLGVCMIFSPWNYPFLLTIQPLISSIAAGNCTILKLSEHSKHTTRLMCDLIDKYFDREYIAAYVDSFEAVKAIRREQLGLIFYTGGSTVARIIMKAAAAQLTPVVLELGGKSPCIIDKTANLRLAARRIVSGKLINAGQTCVAPDYIYIDSSVKDEFVGYVREYHDRFCQGSPTENKFYPKIINKMHFERLKNYLNDGTILMGGEVDEDACKISLTLMEKIRRDSKLMSEEIFGPILPIFEFNDIQYCDKHAAQASEAARALSVHKEPRVPPAGTRKPRLRLRLHKPTLSCSSRIRTCRSAASATAAWGATTARRASTRSAPRPPFSAPRLSI